jgi:hypothetical protein
VCVNCTAHSNPPLATATWRHGGGSVLDLVVDRNMSVEQICNVSTRTVQGDNRLPLNKSRTLLVYTKCEYTFSQPVYTKCEYTFSQPLYTKCEYFFCNLSMPSVSTLFHNLSIPSVSKFL